MDKIFDNKKTYIASDGEEMINLSIPCVDISKIGVRSMIKVSQPAGLTGLFGKMWGMI